MPYLYTLLLTTTAFVLVSCANNPTPIMTKQACDSYDPYQSGYISGANGDEYRFNHIRTACTQQGVELSTDEYSKGWQDGRRESPK